MSGAEQRMSAAAAVILAEMQFRVSPMWLAAGLESHRLLCSPEDAAELEQLRAERSAPQLVYRASYEGMQLGLYATEAAAREHCEAAVSDEHPPSEALLFDWDGEDDDPGEPRELIAHVNGEDQPTGYLVTALEVAAAYRHGEDEAEDGEQDSGYPIAYALTEQALAGLAGPGRTS